MHQHVSDFSLKQWIVKYFMITIKLNKKGRWQNKQGLDGCHHLHLAAHLSIAHNG